MRKLPLLGLVLTLAVGRADALPDTMMGLSLRDISICDHDSYHPDSGEVRNPTNELVIESCSRLLKHAIVETNYKVTFLLGRGDAYYNKHQYELALADMTAAVELRQRDVSARYYRAKVLARIGQFDTAMADLNQAVEIDPIYAWAFAARGTIWLRKGIIDRAVDDFTRADEIPFSKPYFRLMRAIAYRRGGKSELAAADFDAVVADTPRIFERYVFQCWARAVDGRNLDAALANCAEAVRLRPESGEALENMAFAELRAGHFADAIHHYDAALAGDPNLETALYGRGLAKLKTGDTAGGNADIALAVKWNAGIADIFASDYGVKP